MKNSISEKDFEYLLTPVAIRNTTKKIYDLALSGKTNFSVDESKIEACSDFVLEVINKNYPDHNIPFHSRWGHFKVGNIDREKKFNNLLSDLSPIDRARTKLDLVITSVLLDAGAGKDWKYLEGENYFNRSEGLAVASYYLFTDQSLSSENKLESNSEGLSNLTKDTLENAFQVTSSNPLIGVDGRLNLLKSLGRVVGENSEIFPRKRPGSIIDYLINKHGNEFEVGDILNAVLVGLGPIWPGRIDVNGKNLGDVWHYAPLGSDVSIDSVICFHKLSQWLTYSLVTPMIEAGLKITGAEKLTGLSEYRNGGLFLDFGVINLRDEKNKEKSHKPSSDLIIEWRALTLQLLDRVGVVVQKKLNKSPEDFPLAKVLEGGTWWAGRVIAKKLRESGEPPLQLDSDGTVF